MREALAALSGGYVTPQKKREFRFWTVASSRDWFDAEEWLERQAKHGFTLGSLYEPTTHSPYWLVVAVRETDTVPEPTRGIRMGEVEVR